MNNFPNWSTLRLCYIKKVFTATAMAVIASLSTTISSHGDERAYILDTHVNAARFADKLKSRGIKVIGRYYARKRQNTLPEKRIAYQEFNGKPEVEVLLNKGFSILSIYQYNSSSRRKFLEGFSDTRSTEEEARADAKAALEQAEIVGQTPGSAIYFGVDFNLNPSDEATKRAVRKYFQVIKNEFNGKYKIGAYGNGVALRLLTSGGSPLIDYAWISASVGYHQTSDYYSETDTNGKQKWTLYQHQVDRFTFGRNNKCPDWARALPHDLNIMNPSAGDAGFWGQEQVSAEIVKKVFDSRRFSETNNQYVRTKPSSSAPVIEKYRCRYVQVKKGAKKKVWKNLKDNRVTKSRNARVKEVPGSPSWYEVDIDDDDEFDGFILKSMLPNGMSDMPPYRQK